MGRQILHRTVYGIFSVNFSNVQLQLSNNFQKKCGYFDWKWGKTWQQCLFEGFFIKKLCFSGKTVAFWTVFRGQRWPHWCVDDQNYDQNKSNWHACLLLSKVDNIQNPCLFQKLGFFPLVYWFVNLTLTDKHGTKHLQGLTRSWNFCRTFISSISLLLELAGFNPSLCGPQAGFCHSSKTVAETLWLLLLAYYTSFGVLLVTKDLSCCQGNPIFNTCLAKKWPKSESKFSRL